jgi:hypothetical protein
MGSLRLWGETHLVDLVFPVLVECVCSWNASLCTKGVYPPAFGRSGDPGATVGPGLQQLLGHREKGIQAVSAPVGHVQSRPRRTEPSEMGKVYFFWASLNSPRVRCRCIPQIELQLGSDVHQKRRCSSSQLQREAEICINRIAAKGLAGRGGGAAEAHQSPGPDLFGSSCFVFGSGDFRLLTLWTGGSPRHPRRPGEPRDGYLWEFAMECDQELEEAQDAEPRLEEKGRGPREDVEAVHPDV